MVEKPKIELIDEVGLVYSNYLKAREFHKRKLDRCFENWQFYVAHNPELGMGQWPDKVIPSMLQQDRHLLQYNFVRIIVDTLAGNLLQVPYDPEFIPTAGEYNSLIDAVKQAMYSDKEIMDWKGTYYDLVIGGLVHEGCFKIVVDRKFDPNGNIAIKNTLPGAVLSDPLWRTWRSSDARRCWHRVWMTAEEIADLNPKVGDHVLAQAAQEAIRGVVYGQDTGATPFKTETSSWGSLHEVIEEYSMVKRKSEQDFVVTVDGEVPIPNHIPKEQRKDWLDANIVDEAGQANWSPDGVYTKPVAEDVCIIKTIAPGIVGDVLINRGPTEVQCGSLPFKWWSASRANGEACSIIDSIKDVQLNINYWESMITHKLQTEGEGGSLLADESGFWDHTSYVDFVHNRNKPTKVFKVKPGALDGGRTIVRAVAKTGFPNEAYKNLEHLIGTILPSISKVTPATLGRTENEQQDVSGKLYNMLKVQSDVQSYTIHYGLRMFWNDFYESYLIQAPQTYGMEFMPPELRKRDFLKNNGREKITINEMTELPDGRKALKNDISQLKEMRLKVIISEQQESPSQNIANIETMARLIQSLPPSKGASIGYLFNNIIRKMEQIPDEDKAKLQEISDLELARDIANIQAQIAQAGAVQAQSAMAAQQAAMAPPPPPGMGGTAGGEAPPIPGMAGMSGAPAGQVQPSQNEQAASQGSAQALLNKPNQRPQAAKGAV